MTSNFLQYNLNLMERGEIFDLGFGEYAEYIEPYDENFSLIVFYTKEKQRPFSLRKIVTKIDKSFLEDQCRKIGKNEKGRLLFVYADIREERDIPAG